MPTTSEFPHNSADYWINRERVEHDRRRALANRIAALTGKYGNRAQETGNPDLAELVDELRKAIDLPPQGEV